MNYVRFKPQRGLFHLDALIYECVGAAYIIEFMKERLSSTNETTVQEDTGVIGVHRSTSQAASGPVCF